MAAAHPGTSLPDKIVVSIVGHSAVPRDEKCHKSIRYLLRSSYEKLFPDEPQPVVHYSGHPGLTLNCTEQWESIYADVNRRKSTCVLIYAGDNDLFTKKGVQSATSDVLFNRVLERMRHFAWMCPNVETFFWSLLYPRNNNVDGYQHQAAKFNTRALNYMDPKKHKSRRYGKIQFMTGGTMYAKEWEEPDLSFLKDEVHADPCLVDYPEVMYEPARVAYRQHIERLTRMGKKC